MKSFGSLFVLSTLLLGASCAKLPNSACGLTAEAFDQSGAEEAFAEHLDYGGELPARFTIRSLKARENKYHVFIVDWPFVGRWHSAVVDMSVNPPTIGEFDRIDLNRDREAPITTTGL